MTKQLSGEQLDALAKYDRYFHQAVEARYCSYPGAAAIDEMLRIWNDLTGQSRRVCRSCPDNMFRLVADLGTVYFAQKERAEKEAAEKPVSLPATAMKAQRASKPMPARRKAVKAKN